MQKRLNSLWIILFGLLLLTHTANAQQVRSFGGQPRSAAGTYFNPNSFQQAYMLELQRNMNYPVVDFVPKTSFSEIIHLPGIKTIRMVDGRYDTQKVGFVPSDKKVQFNKVYVVGLQLTHNLMGWLKEKFLEPNVVTGDSSTDRQLVIVLKKYWFGHSANEPYTAKDPKLITSLHYHFEVFSYIPAEGYFAQKKVEGVLSAPYNHSLSYNTLSDSLLVILQKNIQAIHFETREIEKNIILPEDFVTYYNNQYIERLSLAKKSKGVYETYEDFLNNRPMADSVDLVLKYNNFETTPPYAFQLAAYNQNTAVSANKAWGYFDGQTFYINCGSGLYLKLIRKRNDFLFFYLENIGSDKIKKDLVNRLYINNTPYSILKTYTKAFVLTYQLDWETGQLF